MKRRSTRKSLAADLLVSPLPTASPNRSPTESPKQFEFNFNTSSSLKKNNSNSSNGKSKNTIAASVSLLRQPTGSPPSLQNLSTISDLKDLASSRLGSLKRQLDCSHSEILKDIEASQSRLHKRFKLQTQSCQQVTDEAEREYKKMSERISESQEAMKLFCSGHMLHLQNS